MVGLPLAFTGEYEPPEDGEYATVLIRLNGLPFLRIASDGGYISPNREHEAVTDAITDFVGHLVRDIPGAELA